MSIRKIILTVLAFLALSTATMANNYQAMNLQIIYYTNSAHKGLVSVALVCANNGRRVVETDISYTPNPVEYAVLPYSLMLVQGSCGTANAELNVELLYDTGAGVMCAVGVQEATAQEYNGKQLKLNFLGNTLQSQLQCEFSD